MEAMRLEKPQGIIPLRSLDLDELYAQRGR